VGIRHTSGRKFLPSKNFLPDAILIPRSQSPPYEYIEGGDFRDTLKVLSAEVPSSKFRVKNQEIVFLIYFFLSQHSALSTQHSAL
jgi:hypothetical protein